MKKLIVFPLKKKLYRGLGKAVAAVILLGMAHPCMLQVSAEETNRTETYVCHRHIGSDREEGGCYHIPSYHTHEGSEAESGGCYTAPVYHVHAGDETAGGSCYGTAFLHEHTGSDEEEGGCYVKKPHKHGSSCYRTVSSQEYGCYEIRTVDTNDGDYEGHDFKYYYMSCGEVVHGTNSSHGHSVLNCSKQYDSGYTLGCGKTEESIDSYLLDCEKTEGESIDSYALGCGKTTADIDGYTLSCGSDEAVPVGKITVTEEKGDSKEETSIKVSFEDLSGGKLHLTEEPFTWYDSKGHVIGTGESISVSENGQYSVVLGMVNEDVNKDSLKARIGIRSIVKPAKDSGGNNGGGSNDDDNGGDEDGRGDSGEENSGEGENVFPLATPSPAVPGAITEEAPKSTPGRKNSKQSSTADDGKPKADKADTEIKEAPSSFPKWLEKKESIKLPEKKSQGEEIAEIEIKEQKETFPVSPAVKLITITAGTLFAILGLLALLYYLRMSVRIYNDDGKGGMIYLGRCMVKLTEDGYTVTISDEMEEKAVTNRYYIRPGLFRFLRGEDEELLVCRLKKRISVYLSKEMTIVI